MKLNALMIGALAAIAVAVSAEPGDAKKGEFGELMERARKAKEEGRYDEAREIAERIRKMRGMEEKRGEHLKHDGARRPDLEHLKTKVEELNREGKHEEAEHLKKQAMGEFMAHRKEGGPPKVAGGDDRLDHVMEAIKHLRAAKLNEPAENLEQVAAKLREEMEVRKREEAAKHVTKKAGPGPAAGELEALRHQVKELSASLEQIRNELAKERGEQVKKPQKP